MTRLLAAIVLVALIDAGCSNAPAETGSGGSGGKCDDLLPEDRGRNR